jgi:UDP-3-O-[3-hydroxymyristoyl] glucosamine N-acyltransferase
MKSVSSQNLIHLKSLKLQYPADITFSNVRPAEMSDSNSLVFVSTKNMLEVALNNKVQGFIILEKIYSETKDLLSKNFFVATTQNIQWAMSEILFLFDKNKLPAPSKNIHTTAIINPTARIGKNVSVAPYAVIENDVVIEDNVSIGAHTVIEHNSVIQENTEISAHVFVGSYSQIGKNCKIASHVVLGSDGFGFFTDKNFTHHKIAQIGIVVLEDNVELGAHCAIDRATLTETRIKSGSKFDNHCHIAHNCVIGENAAVAAGFIVAGSTTIGKNFMSSGNVGVLGHLKLTDHIVLTARTGVINSLEKSGVYGGFPAIEHKENLKILAVTSHLPKIKKQITQIMKHLGLE